MPCTSFRSKAEVDKAKCSKAQVDADRRAQAEVFHLKKLKAFCKVSAVKRSDLCQLNFQKHVTRKITTAMRTTFYVQCSKCLVYQVPTEVWRRPCVKGKANTREKRDVFAVRIHEAKVGFRKNPSLRGRFLCPIPCATQWPHPRYPWRGRQQSWDCIPQLCEPGSSANNCRSQGSRCGLPNHIDRQCWRTCC